MSRQKQVSGADTELILERGYTCSKLNVQVHTSIQGYHCLSRIAGFTDGFNIGYIPQIKYCRPTLILDIKVNCICNISLTYFLI